MRETHDTVDVDNLDPADLDRWIADLGAAAAERGIPVRTYQYGSDPEQVADLRLPTGSTRSKGSKAPTDKPPYPVVALVHGGNFRAHFDRTIMDAVAVDLTRRGYATWNIEYRRLDCGGGPTATTGDITEALRYLATADVGADSALNLEDMTILGHSAGGYLSLWAAGLPFVSRVVALGSICDLRLLATDAETPYARLAGGMPSNVPEVYEALDLTRRFPTGARTAMLCGTADEPIRVQENRALATAAQEHGEDLSYRELPHVGHFAFIDSNDAAWHAAVDAVEQLRT